MLVSRSRLPHSGNKFTVRILLSTFIGLMIQAQPGVASPEGRQDRKLEKEFRDLISCTHQMISENTIDHPDNFLLKGVESIPGLVGAEWLEKGLKALKNGSLELLSAQIQDCETLRRSGITGSLLERNWLQKLSQSTGDQERDARALLAKYSSSSVAAVVSDFLAGMSHGVRGVCQGLGLQVVAAIRSGVGASIQGTWCRMRDGQQWLELVPSTSKSLGFGVGVLGDIGIPRSLSLKTRNLPKTRTDDTQGYVFLGAGPAFTMNDGDLELEDLGIGIGAIWGLRKELHIRIAQLPMRTREISRRLQTQESFEFGSVSSTQTQIKKRMKKILRAASELIRGQTPENERRNAMGDESIPSLIASDFLEGASEASHRLDLAQLDDILIRAQTLQKGFSESHEVLAWQKALERMNAEDTEATTLIQKGYPVRSGLITTEMLRGKTQQTYATCHSVGPQVTAGFLLSLGAGADASYCQAEDGIQWIEARGTGYVGLGVGAIAVADLGFAHRRRVNTAMLRRFEKEDGLSLGGGLILALMQSPYSDESLDGIGVGGFSNNSYSRVLRARALPLNTNFLLEKLNHAQ